MTSMKHRNKQTIRHIRRSHLGRQLFELNKHYIHYSLAILRENGFPEMTQGYLTVLSQIDLEGGTGMKELIVRVGTSKQGVSRTLATCEDLGFIRRKPLETDQRGKKLVFTRRGEALMAAAAEAIEQTETYYRRLLGKRVFGDFKRILTSLNKELELVKVDRTD